MDNAVVEIGSCIKQIRLAKKMSIRELAKKAGITPSMLSQIERDLVNPSINTLKTLSVELGVPMYQFFQADSAKQGNLVVRKGNRKWLGDSSKNIAYELLTPDVRGEIEFCIMHVPSGTDREAFSMSHEGEEVAYILSGKTDIFVNDVPYTLETGDSIRIPPHAYHSWHNSYGELCHVIFAVTPPSF